MLQYSGIYRRLTAASYKILLLCSLPIAKGIVGFVALWEGDLTPAIPHLV